MAERHFKGTIQMDKLFGTEWMGWQGCKGLWCMVNPKDVPAGQGEEDNREAGICGRIKRIYSSAKTC